METTKTTVEMSAQEATTKTTVEMTAEQATAFAAFMKEQERQKAEEKKKEDTIAYYRLVEEAIDKAIPMLVSVSSTILETKKSVIKEFEQALQIKKDLFEVEAGQHSHSFTNSDGTKRIIIGRYTIDNYRDTVNEGIAIVNEVIKELGKDEESKILSGAVLRLMARDQRGTLKASRVLQLENIALQSKNERLIEGVRIIKESYQPIESKQYIRAELKDSEGKWIPVALGMTEAGEERKKRKEEKTE